MTASLFAAASGLGLGLSLIIAIGAQNAFVLRQGLRGEHVPPVVAICVLSDITLIVAGVAGAGALVSRSPGILGVVRVAGAAFLLGYAGLAALRALRPGRLDAETDPPSRRASPGLGPTVSTCLALTWLNPHVYLDTVVLLGSVAATHAHHRWAFAAGACTASTMWFAGLGFGARLLRPLFERPGAWRVLDAGIALVMLTLAASLIASL